MVLAAAPPLLTVTDLRIEFPYGGSGWVPVVDGVTFELQRGESLGFVGESGSGKTMTALSLLGLIPAPGRIGAGRIELDGSRLDSLDGEGWATVRSRQIGIVFQDAMSGLNPVRSIGSVLTETYRRHNDVTRAAARARVLEILEGVGIPAPAERLDVYPHQLSGGLRQRVMIALAIINRPAVIIADEPTTALDATIQAQILDLLRSLVRDAALILITHDLGVAASICDRIAVIYAGRIAEVGTAAEVLGRPRHPYTAGLLAAVPGFEPDRRPLVPIAGTPPNPTDVLSGCAFAPRCPRALDRCPADRPPLEVRGDRLLACWNPVDV